MSYDSEWDKHPTHVGRIERILTAVDDFRNLFSMHGTKDQLKAILGPENYRRAFEYLDCIDTNARKLRARRRPDSRCPDRESGGARCELPEGHPGPHACPEALASFVKARGGTP